MQLQIDNLGKVAVTVEEDYWSNTKDYDKLTIVEQKGVFGTFISRKPVPAGTPLTNRKYWIPFSSLKEEIVLNFNHIINEFKKLEGGFDSIKEETLNENRGMVNSILENYAPVEINGDVNNAADEEDLTFVNVSGTDVLKLKDKSYNSLVFSGLGNTNLRKNIQKITVEGVTTTKNILTQSMINTANTIYNIQYDYDLNGEEIIIPENCTLNFHGGSINNGKIVLSGVNINTDTLIFTNVKVSGNIKNNTIESFWFYSFDDFASCLSNTIGYNTVNIKQGIYNTGTSISIYNSVTINGNNATINVEGNLRNFITIGKADEPETIVSLISPATKGDKSIVVSDNSNFKRGDLIFIRDRTTSSFNYYRNYQEGEMAMINSISENGIINLSTGIYGTYKQDNLDNCIVFKHTTYVANINNLFINYISERQTTERTAISLMYGQNFNISQLIINNFDIGIGICASYNGNVSFCNITTPYDETYNGRVLNQYGVAIANSQYIDVNSIKGVCGNHVCAIGGSYSDYYAIVSRFITFDNITGKSLHNSYPGINIHGDGEYITFNKCNTNGIDVGGNYITIKDCRFETYPTLSGEGCIRLNEITGYNITIDSCTILGGIDNTNNYKTVNRIDDVQTFTLKNSKLINPPLVSFDKNQSYPYNVKVFIYYNNIISNKQCFIAASVPGFSFFVSNNYFYNVGFNITTSELTIENNFFESTNSEILRINNPNTRDNKNITFNNNFVKSSSNLVFRFNSFANKKRDLFIFSNNQIISTGNNLSIATSYPIAETYVFANNMIQASTPFHIMANNLYIDDVFFNNILSIVATNIFKGILPKQGVSNIVRIWASESGNTDSRPSIADTGHKYFDTTLNKPIYWNNKWIDEKGYTAVLSKGTTEQRPTDILTTDDAGYQYFDTTLGMPIYLKVTGSTKSWIKADGTEA